MNNKILIMLLTVCCSCKISTSNIMGKYHLHSEVSISVNIIECTNDTIIGTHCFVVHGGDKIDCSVDDYSLYVVHKEKNQYNGVLHSYYDGKKYDIIIRFNKTSLSLDFLQEHPFLYSYLLLHKDETSVPAE